MRAFKIDIDGINEVEADLEHLLTEDVTWDCVSLDNGHDVWVDDVGLLRERVMTAIVDDRHRVPLPALILAADGERSVSATLTMEQVRTLVRIDRHSARHWDPNAGSVAVPAIGFDSAVDAEGRRHPWRAVLAFDDGQLETIEYLIRLPEGDYTTPTVHPVHGDLTGLPLDARQQAEAICLAMRLRGHDVAMGAFRSAENDVDRRLEGLGVHMRCIVVAEPDDPADRDDARGVGGLAGHEVSHLLDPELCERGMEAWHDRHVAAERARASAGTGQEPTVPENQAA